MKAGASRAVIPCCTLGPDAAGQVYVGVGADDSRLPQALLVLQCMADRRATAAPAPFQSVIDEIVALRRIGFRFIALADDNFYPVTLTDLRLAREQGNSAKFEELTAIRDERFELMEELAKLPKDMVFFTQITMEAGEDGDYLDAMRKANIKGALVGVEAVTPEGLKAVSRTSTLGRGAGEAVADVQAAWRACAGLVHLRPADGQACYLRRDR